MINSSNYSRGSKQIKLIKEMDFVVMINNAHFVFTFIYFLNNTKRLLK